MLAIILQIRIVLFSPAGSNNHGNRLHNVESYAEGKGPCPALFFAIIHVIIHHHSGTDLPFFPAPSKALNILLIWQGRSKY